MSRRCLICANINPCRQHSDDAQARELARNDAEIARIRAQTTPAMTEPTQSPHTGEQVTEANDGRISEMARIDDFKGDNAKLIRCIDALLDMDDDKCLVPHGLGGKGSHAYRLLCAARHRLTTAARQPEAQGKAIALARVAEGHKLDCPCLDEAGPCNCGFDLAASALARQPKAMADQSTEARLREALKPFVDCCEYIDENESDEEWAKFRLLIKDYRRSQEAFSLPVQDTSDELTRLRAEVEARDEALDAAHYYIDASDEELKEAGMTRAEALFHARALRTTLNGEQANGL